MKKTTMLAVSVVLVLVVAFTLVLAACDDGNDKSKWLEDAVERDDYTSVYDKIGKSVTIADVTENSDGSATITKDGKTYTLGLDFLSMAMVYNCTPAGGFETEEDVYNQWWKLYIQRWNKVVPEVPLYSNQYFDIYAAKIDQFKTSPYWSGADAVVGATSTDGQIILGSNTELSGLFRLASFGKTSPGSSDLDIQNLTTGYSTLVSNFDGAYIWNDDVVEEHSDVINSDGTRTFTLKIKSGLKDSKGREINADNYLAYPLVLNTPVFGAAGGSSSGSMSLEGYDEFLEYDGTNASEEGVSRYFKALKKLGDYEFSVTVSEDYATYYYANTYAAFSPSDVDLYLCGASIVVDPETKCVGLSDNFYQTEVKNDLKSFVNASKLNANINNNSAEAFAFTGPYTVKEFSAANKTAVLEKNPHYVTETYRKFEQSLDGNITTVSYVYVTSSTQNAMLQNGEVNVLQGITGGDETKAALALCADGKFKETHYDRAGYGKLAFKGDYGPTQYMEVRQAIMHSINRPSFADTFTGGYGAVVNGPYYTGSAAYKAVKDSIILDEYSYSKDRALSLIKQAGFVFNADGSAYDEAQGGVRYVKLEGYYLSAANIQYESLDKKYSTTRVKNEDGSFSYFMPLVINWSSTLNNPVSTLLKTTWKESSLVSEIGMYVTMTEGDFTPIVYGDYYQMAAAGYSRGNAPICSCVNFATGFTSAVYDQSFYWTLDPDMYADYNMQLMDPADFWADYQ